MSGRSTPAVRAARLEYARRTSAERFWARVQTSEDCWLWSGATDSNGYGRVQDDRRYQAAHRYTWEQTNGPIPDGMEVCHRCDNPLCVRVDHLFLGTHADNMADMCRKGRHVAAPQPGESHPLAKLTDGDVRAIRVLRAQGALLKDLSAQFGVVESRISAIARGEAWRHLDVKQ